MTESKTSTFTGYLGSDFQLKLFWQILTEFDFGNKIFPDLEVSYFDDSTHKQYFIVLNNYFNDNERVPNLKNKSVYEAIENNSNNLSDIDKTVMLDITEKINNWNKMINNGQIPNDGDIIQKNAFQFIKQQEYRKLASFINEKTKEGSIRTNKNVIVSVEEKIKAIYNIGVEEDDGVDVFSNLDDVLSSEYRQTVPTGIKALDEIMGGGLGKGEIGIMLAASGIGKSTFLTKVSNTAVNGGKNVIQIILEDRPKDIQRKHHAIWSGIKLSDLTENKDFVKEEIIKKNKAINKHGGLLTIKKFPQDETTIVDVKKWIERVQKKFGIKYHLLVLDYIDCLESHKPKLDPHQAELAIIKSFEAMASDFDIPAWTAIQGNRSAFNTDFLGAEQMSGNIKRAQKTHFLMSVAKTPQQKESGTANIAILKARFAQDGQTFKDCIFNNNTMEIRITDTEYRVDSSVPKTSLNELDKIIKNDTDLHTKISNKDNENSGEEDKSNINDILEQYKNFKDVSSKGLDNVDDNLKVFLKKQTDNQGDINKNEKNV